MSAPLIGTPTVDKFVSRLKASFIHVLVAWAVMLKSMNLMYFAEKTDRGG